MNTNTNTPESRPVPYVRTSMRSLNKAQWLTSMSWMLAAVVATSTWVIGDRAPGTMPIVIGCLAAFTTFAIGMFLGLRIISDATRGHRAQGDDLAPAIAAVLASLGVAAYSADWIQFDLVVVGAGGAAAQLPQLRRVARTQLREVAR